jgi:hypothetical protein
MTLALQCLVGLVLLVGGAVAAVPEIVRHREPRPRVSRLPDAPRELWIVRSGDQGWFANGEPIAPAQLEALLGRGRSADLIPFLPSAALSLGEVSRSLAWLRSRSRTPVVLELPPDPR